MRKLLCSTLSIALLFCVWGVSPAQPPATEKGTLIDNVLKVLDDKNPAAKSQEPAAKPAAAKPDKPKEQILVRFTLTGEYPEEKDVGMMVALGSLGGNEQPNLFEMIQRMDAAAKDKDVTAVWLRLDDFQPTRGNIEEFRAAIARIRKAGKPVFAEIYTYASAGVYQVALACDRIYMAEGREHDDYRAAG